MSLRSFIYRTITDFRGAWTIGGQGRQSSQRGSVARNVRFLPGKIYTRGGISQIYVLGTGAIRSLYGWIANVSNVPVYRIVYFEAPNKVKMYTINVSPGIQSLYTVASCSGISAAEGDNRLYIGHFNSSGLSMNAPLQIINTTISAAPVDVAFPDPINVSFTMSDLGTGLVSQGDHKFAYRMISRTGFPGRMSPATGLNFLPVTYTVAAGGRKVRMFFGIWTTPSDAAYIQCCMTTADNTEEYFDIPGAIQATPTGGGVGPVSIDINITDEDLILGNSVTDNFSYLTLSHGAPQPSKVVRLGNRNVYIAVNKAYISDPYDTQVLLDPDNVVQVDGQRFILTAEALGTQLVLFGPNWTYVLSGDNSRKPREWAPPSRVSELLGTPSINGVCPSSGYSFLWVAHPTGLYMFNGAYSPVPLSLMFDNDWRRINWTAPTVIQMIDSADERCLYINVPLDGATEANYRMVIDYSRARLAGTVDPFSLDYSLDDYKAATALPAIASVQNINTGQTETWFGTLDGRAMRVDPTARVDDGTSAIHPLYETGLALTPAQTKKFLSRFGGVQMDIIGEGRLYIQPYGLGRMALPADDVDPLDLETQPDGKVELRWDLVSENESLQLEAPDVGAWFELQELNIYYRPGGSTKES